MHGDGVEAKHIVANDLCMLGGTPLEYGPPHAALFIAAWLNSRFQ
jgi:hypothetical protein